MEVASARSARGLSARVLPVLMGLLAAALAGLVAWSAVLGADAFEQRQQEAQRQQALHAARQVAVNLLSLDYRTIDRDIDRVLNGTTGQFRDQFASRTGVVEQVLPEAEAASEAQIHSAGVSSMDGDSAEVMLIADATVRNANQEEPRNVHYRLSLTVERQDGRWLVSEVRYIG